MRLTPRRAAIALGGVLAAALLAGCTQASPDPTAAPPASGEPAPSPSASVDNGEAQPDPTCHTILTPAMVEGFAGLGWTPESDPFILGDTELDGLLCKWADYDQANSNEVQIYGWARIDPADVEAAATLLEEQGWRREDTDGGIILTEDPAFAMIVDEAGYGMTYLFGDGWVIVADTRQNLVLIDRPA